MALGRWGTLALGERGVEGPLNSALMWRPAGDGAAAAPRPGVARTPETSSPALQFGGCSRGAPPVSSSANRGKVTFWPLGPATRAAFAQAPDSSPAPKPALANPSPRLTAG